VNSGRDAEYTEYVEARLSSLRRLAMVLCGDWQRADDVTQATLTRLYVHWGKVRAASHADAYARAVLVREFLHERRSTWVKRVSLQGGAPESPAAEADHDAVLDLRTAVAALPARQRATLVLRFYCDMGVDQCAEILGCSPGTVKSQTARALDAVRRALGQDEPAGSGDQPATVVPPQSSAGKASFGPSGSFESRTATTAAWVRATSTHPPPLVVLGRVSRATRPDGRPSGRRPEDHQRPGHRRSQVTLMVVWKPMIAPHSRPPDWASAFPGVAVGPQAIMVEVMTAVPRRTARNDPPVTPSCSIMCPLACGCSTAPLARMADHLCGGMPLRNTCTAVPGRTHTIPPLSA